MQSDTKNLKFLIIIPAYNEEQTIGDCLLSLVSQTKLPQKIIVVNDSSTDNTAEVVQALALKHPLITYKQHQTDGVYRPGSKIVNAFNYGLVGDKLDGYDVICKFDADLIFPKHYIESVEKSFLEDDKLGLSGGVCLIEKGDDWVVESVTNLDHVRGALKAYRLEAFKSIDGLASQMGWDTADEFKLRYAGWHVGVNPDLQVKQTKPTASSYKNQYFKKQGEVFFALRYDFLLCCIAAVKISKQRQSIKGFFNTFTSYLDSNRQKIPYLLSNEEGKFLRSYRYRRLKEKLFS